MEHTPKSSLATIILFMAIAFCFIGNQQANAQAGATIKPATEIFRGRGEYLYKYSYLESVFFGDISNATYSDPNDLFSGDDTLLTILDNLAIERDDSIKKTPIVAENVITPATSGVIPLKIKAANGQEGALFVIVSATDANVLSITNKGLVSAHRGVKLGRTDTAEFGNLRAIGSDAEFYDGTQWVSLTAGASTSGSTDVFRSGTPSSGQVTFWEDFETIAGDSNFTWDKVLQVLNVSGDITASGQITTNESTDPPFVVQSNKQVDNLNVEFLGGKPRSYYEADNEFYLTEDSTSVQFNHTAGQKFFNVGSRKTNDPFDKTYDLNIIAIDTNTFQVDFVEPPALNEFTIVAVEPDEILEGGNGVDTNLTFTYNSINSTSVIIDVWKKSTGELLPFADVTIDSNTQFSVDFPSGSPPATNDIVCAVHVANNSQFVGAGEIAIDQSTREYIARVRDVNEQQLIAGISYPTIQSASIPLENNPNAVFYYTAIKIQNNIDTSDFLRRDLSNNLISGTLGNYQVNIIADSLTANALIGDGSKITGINAAQIIDASYALLTDLEGLETAGFIESTTNKFFTNERAQDAFGALVSDSGTINLTYDDLLNNFVASVVFDSIGDNEMDYAEVTLNDFSGTIDISDNTNLSVGTGLTLSGDQILLNDTTDNVDDNVSQSELLDTFTNTGFFFYEHSKNTIQATNTVDISDNTNLTVGVGLSQSGDQILLDGGSIDGTNLAWDGSELDVNTNLSNYTNDADFFVRTNDTQGGNLAGDLMTWDSSNNEFDVVSGLSNYTNDAGFADSLSDLTPGTADGDIDMNENDLTDVSDIRFDGDLRMIDSSGTVGTFTRTGGVGTITTPILKATIGVVSDSNVHSESNTTADGSIEADSDNNGSGVFRLGGNKIGKTGTFVDNNGNTITVSGGIITGLN